MKYPICFFQSTVLLLAILISVSSCYDDDPLPIPSEIEIPHELDDNTSNNTINRDQTPEFLLTAWIWPLASNSMRTYDFTQMQVAGKRTVEIGAWYQIGSLNWQTNMRFTAAFEATSQRIQLVSASGYQEIWMISNVEPTRITVTNHKGESYYWYNCKHAGWPPLIHASMKACR